MFSVRQGCQMTKRTTSFGINCDNRNTTYIKLDKKSTRYANLKKLDFIFLEYIRRNTEDVLPEAYKEWADNYRKYAINMEKASVICKQRNGYSFEDAVEYFKHTDSFKLNDVVYLKNRKAYNEYFMCKSFNSNSYIVKEVYGRLYTPFHNLSKDYREQFYRRKTSDSLVELADMKGAFIKGSICITAFMMQEFGKQALFSKLMKSVDSISDPYAFAVSDRFSRSYVKKYVLSFFFAKPSHVKYRESCCEKFSKSSSIYEVQQYCSSFLEFVENNPDIMFATYRSLNKRLHDFRYNKSINKMLGVKRLTFTTQEFGSITNIKNFVKLVQRWNDSAMHHYIKEQFIKCFGEDSYEALRFTSTLFHSATQYNLNLEQKYMKQSCDNEYVKPYYKADLSMGNTINSSIICQLAEGEAMFNFVLPELKKLTGSNSLVSLHDAVFCPESEYDALLNVNPLQIMNRSFVEGLFSVYTKNTLVRNAVKLWKSKKGDCFYD